MVDKNDDKSMVEIIADRFEKIKANNHVSTVDYVDSITRDGINKEITESTSKSTTLQSTQSTESHKSTQSTYNYSYNKLIDIVRLTKWKILVICLNQEKTSEEIGDELNLTRKQINEYMRKKRNGDHTGLLVSNYIETFDKKDRFDLYKTSELGLIKLNEIIEEYEKLQGKIQEQKEQESQKAFELEQQRKLLDERIEHIKEFIELEYSNKLSQNDLIRVDFMKVAKYNPDLADLIIDNFEDTQREFVVSFQQFNNEFNNIISFYNLPESSLIPVNSLDYKNFNKVVMIEGMIKSRTERMPKVTKITYECMGCGDIKHIFQNNKYLAKMKVKCLACSQNRWKEIDHSYVTVQRLEVEEFSENLDGVNEPRSVTLELQNELCKPELQKHFNPGTRIKYWGTLKPEYIDSMNKTKTLMTYYIDVNGFEVLEESLEFTVSDSEKKKIIELSNTKGVLKLLTNSYCPEIIGHKKAKLSLLLSAVKGMMEIPRYKRDRIHVLFVGNPGTGKTVMIKKLVELTRLSRFASGLNSSKVGLLAAVIKDEFLGGYKLSAGAIPLANNGICAIDELDKIPDEDKKTLNSAMEEGEIIVDKASVHQKLKANTTIVASCNPKGERFTPQYDRPFEQFNLPSSLLDRFDITFVVNAEDIKNPFQEMVEEQDVEIIDEELLSKYIIMASYNEPKYNKEELDYLAFKCNEIRLEYKDQEYFFGYRQFHSVRNISIAFAKLMFEDKVTKKCVDKAIELLKATIISRGYHIIK